MDGATEQCLGTGGGNAEPRGNAPWRGNFCSRHVLPGFVPTLSFAAAYLAVLVLIPLSTLIFRGAELGFRGFFDIATDARVLASFRITFGAAFAAAAINLFAGTLVAYFLVRVKFPGRAVVDALIDLPYAMPTAICGIALATIYAPTGDLGAIFSRLGIKIAFAPPGIVVAMIFIGMPFVVRSVQPALKDMGRDLEDAARSRGATRVQVLRRVLVPALSPALLSGFTLAFARGLGEYGTVIFIAGNTPMKTEITSLLIVTQLEQYNYPGASAIALTMLALSFALILGVSRFFLPAHLKRGKKR